MTFGKDVGAWLLAFGSDITDTSKATLFSWLNSVPGQAAQVAVSQTVPDPASTELAIGDAIIAVLQAVQQARPAALGVLDDEIKGLCGPAGGQCSLGNLNQAASELSMSSDFRFGIITLKNVPALASLSSEQYIQQIVIQRAKQLGYTVTQ